MKSMKGYGFRPSDEELIGYLEDITHDRDSLVQYITPLKDICEFEPRELPGLSAMEPGSRRWYFSYSINYKYQKGKLINRATKEGYWKPTGQWRKIKATETNMVIGSKRSLTFHRGHPEGKTKKKNRKAKFGSEENLRNKTKHESGKRNKAKHESGKRNKAVWVMHEYQLHTATPSNQKTFILGKLMKQSEEANVSDENGELRQSSPTNLRNQVAKNISIPEAGCLEHLDSSKPFPDVEAPNGSGRVQNQFSTKKQDNEVQNEESYPQEKGSNQHNILDKNEISNLTFNFGNYASVDPMPRDWGNSYGWTITELEAQKDSALVQNQLSTCEHGNSTGNLVRVNNNKTHPEESNNQHNMVDENEGSSLVANSKNTEKEDFNSIDVSDYDLPNADDEILIMIQSPENCNMLQNLSVTSEQDIGDQIFKFHG